MAERTEAPVIHMGRDSYHYFVQVSSKRRDATRYVRGDIADALLISLTEVTQLLRFALLSTTPEIAKDAMAFIRKAEAAIAGTERPQ